MFMDEARFGRINRPVRCWAPPGARPVVDCQTVREYTYAYGALCPQDGALDSLIMPTMHSECFELFAAEVSKRHPDELVVMVCDGAGSHTATELALPGNVRILTLPPYSPELNPTEQLWDLWSVSGASPTTPTTPWRRSSTSSSSSCAPSKQTAPRSSPSPATPG
jgi:hypothetical protein